MKKSIWIRFLVVIILSVCLCGGISGVLIGKMMQEENEKNMVYSLRLVDYNLDFQSELQKQLDTLNPLTMTKDTRLTVLSKTGEVLADTSVDAEEALENHLDRAEVKTALKKGVGVAARYSETLHQQMLYACIYSQYGDYLIRLSVPYNPWTGFLRGLLPALFLSILISLGVSAVLAKKFTKTVTEPLSEISQEMSKIQSENKIPHFGQYRYPELNSIVVSTAKLSERINLMMENLHLERKKIDYILDNMSEGLILLDEQQNVLTINQSAKKILGCPDEVLSQNIVRYTQNINMLQGIERALTTGEPTGFDLKTADHRIMDTHITQISKGVFSEHATGVIILFIDVTSDRNSQQMRQEFFSNVSHELKTPITSIQGFAELLESGIIKDASAGKDFLSRIKKETQHMTNLINDILMISRLESNQTYDAPAQLRLSCLIQEIISSLQPLAKQNDVEIVADCQDLTVIADPKQMHQLINNLMGNAVKYNKPGGTVCVSLKSEGAGIQIIVTDTGIGIPLESQQRIFERFYRVDKGRSRKIGGTGLGLSIVKHIVQYYKGTIGLKSQLNQGTEITVYLPLRPENGSAPVKNG